MMIAFWDAKLFEGMLIFFFDNGNDNDIDIDMLI